MELRSFTYGVMVGITIFIAAFSIVSFSAGVKWQPVKIDTTR